MSNQPFEGLRVLEFGRYVAGPFAAELLAHGGADIIKLEEIGGDETRRNSAIIPGEGRQFIIKGRGKRDLAIDLQTEAGKAIAHDLAVRSDVIISNLRPGSLRRLGLDFEQISPTAPQLIVAEISGFGKHGPESERASIDLVMQARSGLMLSNRSWDGDRPVASEAFLCDYTAAITLAFGIVTALRERDRTGLGQEVSTSLMQAAFMLQHGTANVVDAVDGWKRDLVTHGASGPEGIAQRRSQMASERWFYNTFTTADGFIAIAAPGRLSPRLAELLGLDDPALSDPSWTMPDDPRPYLTSMYLQAIAAVARWKTDALVAACERLGIPSAPIVTLEAALLSEQASASGAVYQFDHPAVGPITMPQAPLAFSGLEYHAATTSPAYGADSRDILTEVGLDSDRIERLIASGVIGTPGTSPFV